MTKLLSLKEAADKYNVSLRRLETILQKLGIVPRVLSNTEQRDLQWKGYDKQTLKGMFIEVDHVETLAFKLELVRNKPQHIVNEALGQMTLDFD